MSGLICGTCGRTYTEKEGIILALPTNIHALSKEEAMYHDHVEGDASDVHQLHAPRNAYYHEYLWKKINTMESGLNILELGAGSGYDAEHLLSKGKCILSDVSEEVVTALQKKFDKQAEYIVLDALSIPFAQETFDLLFMVATYHHLVGNYDKSAKEFLRVIKPGGRIIIGIEPAKIYFKPVKWLRGILCRAVHENPEEGSQADALMEGFSYGELQKYFSCDCVEYISIKPMWFLAGFLHYGLEFLFRVFRLKKRIQIPHVLEKGIVKFDEMFFHIPGAKYLAWHWIIEIQKKK
ncbi:MAG: class I SAM-dependent methyltransferase [Candidatus Magasanikbacteria bacterium]